MDRNSERMNERKESSDVYGIGEKVLTYLMGTFVDGVVNGSYS